MIPLLIERVTFAFLACQVSTQPQNMNNYILFFDYNPIHGYIPPTCGQLILSRNNSELFPKYILLSVCKLRPTFRISTVKRLKLHIHSISVYNIVHNFQYYILCSSILAKNIIAEAVIEQTVSSYIYCYTLLHVLLLITYFH